ncbi:MAG: lipid-A-disaccharide synthase, partial [Alphaproteobacteria bacterium]
RPGRAQRLARFLDHLLVLLPFEPPHFERHGLTTTWVGHPAVEAAGRGGSRAVARRALDLPASAPVLCVLPGSRRGEVRRLLPIFAATVGLLAERCSDLRVVIPTVATVAETVSRAVATWPVPVRVLSAPEDKYRAFAAADAALAASGTVAVELAVAGVPAVIAYRMAPPTAAVARRLVKVRHVSIPNLLLERTVQPEFLQEACTAPNLAATLVPLMAETPARSEHVAALREAVARLAPDKVPPSTRAARAVLETIAAGVSRQGR